MARCTSIGASVSNLRCWAARFRYHARRRNVTKQQESTPEMWEIVQAGGALMWPIILCSIVAAAIILERLWTLQDRRVLPPDLTQKVWKLVEANQINDKVIAALEQNSPLGKLLAAGLAEPASPARDTDGAARGHRPPRGARARALPQYARHHRRGVAAAGPARHRDRHHQGLQRHQRRRRRRSAHALGRHRRGAGGDRGRPVRGDPVADRLSLSARPRGAHRGGDGEERAAPGRCGRGRGASAAEAAAGARLPADGAAPAPRARWRRASA